jgi:hypothetical protein
MPAFSLSDLKYLLIGLLVIGAYFFGHHIGTMGVQIQFDAYKAEQQAEYVKAQEESRNKENNANNQIRETDNAYAKENHSLSVDYSNILLANAVAAARSMPHASTDRRKRVPGAAGNCVPAQDQKDLIRLGYAAQYQTGQLIQCQGYLRACQKLYNRNTK